MGDPAVRYRRGSTRGRDRVEKSPLLLGNGDWPWVGLTLFEVQARNYIEVGIEWNV
jgi:hypothetical protein